MITADAAAERSEQEYADYLSWAGIKHICPNLACPGRHGEKPHSELVDPRSRSWRISDTPCGWCCKQMVPDKDEHAQTHT